MRPKDIPKGMTVGFLPKEQNRDRIENKEQADAFNRLTDECKRMIHRIDSDLVIGQKTGKRVVRQRLRLKADETHCMRIVRVTGQGKSSPKGQTP
jgi:hypothetical protein